MDSIHELKEESRKLINRITWLQQTAAYAAPEYAVKLHGEVDRLLRHVAVRYWGSSTFTQVSQAKTAISPQARGPDGAFRIFPG